MGFNSAFKGLRLILFFKIHAMILVAIRWPFSSEARFRSHSSPREIYGGRSGNEAVFLRVLPFSPVSDVLPVLCTHLNPHDALTRWTNGRSQRIFQQTMLFRKSERIR